MTWVVTKRQRFYLHDGESLLDGLIRTGHDVSYQCKQGYCGSCRSRVIGHSLPITYPSPPMAHLKDDELLPCVCQIQGVVGLDWGWFWSFGLKGGFVGKRVGKKAESMWPLGAKQFQ